MHNSKFFRNFAPEMKKFITTLAIFGAIFLCLSPSCTRNRAVVLDDTGVDSLALARGNRYARGFVLDDTLGLVRARVFAPWSPDSVMATYLIPSGGYRTIGCSSATHVGFLSELGLTDRIAGMCDPQLVYTPLPESFVNLGNSLAPDPERVLQSGADGVMISTYAPSDMSAARLEAVGIRVFYNNEWRERSPLARAEWIRFVGALFGQTRRADSIFHAVEAAYCALRDERQNDLQNDNARKPKVMSGLDFRGTWYVPSGATYMGALFRDAGFDYAFSKDTRSGSIPLTLEQALVTFNDCDIWLGCNAPSIAELAEMNRQYTLMRPYKTGQVYGFRQRVKQAGGNDFWESGVVHPERILLDLIHIAQSDTSLFYINKLQ